MSNHLHGDPYRKCQHGVAHQPRESAVSVLHTDVHQDALKR
jgi:hypothetical protein